MWNLESTFGSKTNFQLSPVCDFAIWLRILCQKSNYFVLKTSCSKNTIYQKHAIKAANFMIGFRVNLNGSLFDICV